MNDRDYKIPGTAFQSLASWWLAFFCVGIAIFLSVWRGQDANWDLRNYHYYNPYSWVNNRASIDIAPAQLQSFHSPFADLPYYCMAKAGLPSWLVSAILALPAAMALFFLALISKRLLPCARQNIYLVAVILIAATGASGGPLIGTTMSEWHMVALFLCAIWLILKSSVRENVSALGGTNLWSVLCAGFLGGLAVGLKLTAGTYAIGLAVLVFSLPAGLLARFKRLAALGFGGAIGATISYGPWGYELWNRFGNPLFPYFNDIFQSPWAEPLRFADNRYIADSLWKFIATPWLIMKENASFVSEMPFRDWRLGLGLPAMLWLAWRSPIGSIRQIWRVLLLMFLAIYCVWIIFFGHFRYVSLLELIAAIAIVSFFANCAIILQTSRIRNVTLLLMLVILIGSTKWPSWGRVGHGEIAVEARMPNLPNGSMVVIASLEPLAYIVPSLPPDVPVISVANNFMNPAWGANFKLHSMAAQRVAQHSGPLFALVSLTNQPDRYFMNIEVSDLLLAIGLVVNFADCKPVVGPMSSGTVGVCSVNRVTAIPFRGNH